MLVQLLMYINSRGFDGSRFVRVVLVGAVRTNACWPRFAMLKAKVDRPTGTVHRLLLPTCVVR